MLACALECYKELNPILSQKIIDTDCLVDKKNRDLFRNMLCLVSVNPWGQEAIMDYHTAIRYLERVADRSTNIGELVYYIAHGEAINAPVHKELNWDDN